MRELLFLSDGRYSLPNGEVWVKEGDVYIWDYNGESDYREQIAAWEFELLNTDLVRLWEPLIVREEP